MPEVALLCTIPVFLQLSCNLCYVYWKHLIHILEKVCIAFLHFLNLPGIYVVFTHIQIKSLTLPLIPIS